MPKLMSEKSASSIVYVTGHSNREDSLQFVYFDVIKPSYQKHLITKGVILPNWGSQAAAALSLLTVAHQRGEMIDKKLGTRMLNNFGFPTDDCQDFRQLYGRSYGFNISNYSMLKKQGCVVRRGTYYLNDLENPSYLFVQGKDGLNPVRHLNSECKYCHTLPGNRNPLYGGIIQFVSETHGDPRKPWADDEHVWLCDICNRTLQDKFVFDTDAQILERL